MKKYNSFLGAFFSGDNGQGGYNAAYRQGALAKLYTGSLPPEQQQEAVAGLARVDPDAAYKFRQTQQAAQQESLKRKAMLIANAPPAQRGQLYASVLPEIRKDWADAPDVYDANIDAMVTNWAKTVSGATNQNTGVQSTFISGGKLHYLTRDGKPVDTGIEVDDSFQAITDPVTGQISGYGKRGNVLKPTTVGENGKQPPPQAGGEAIGNPVSVQTDNEAPVDFSTLPADEQKALTLASQAAAQGKPFHYTVKGGVVAPAAPQQARINVKPDEPKPATWNAPVVETRGGKQVRVRYGTQDGQPIEQVIGEAEPDIKPKKPWPTAALKVYSTLSGDLQVTEQLDTMMADMKSLFSDPKFELGPIQNKQYEYANWSGNSTPQSRAYAKLSANLSKLRNDSLRLNKGTQTDGDAQRAWDEIMANMNDKELVMERLADIERYNELALAEKQYQLEVFEEQYGKPNATRPPANPPAGGARPSAGAPVKISTKQQYDALPSGTEYIGPDGKKARKK